MSFKHVFVNELTPFAYEKLLVASDAVSVLNPNLAAASIGCFITVESNNIRYRIDGDEPDANNGHLVHVNQNLWFSNPSSVRNFKAIAEELTSTLIITYYR